ncbi:MAG TPA: hypothetical protein VIR59_13360 [Gaiellaceae bacterium]
MWLQWLAAFRAGDEQQAKFLRERFRPGLLHAHDIWVAKAVAAPDGRSSQDPRGRRSPSRSTSCRTRLARTSWRLVRILMMRQLF